MANLFRPILRTLARNYPRSRGLYVPLGARFTSHFPNSTHRPRKYKGFGRVENAGIYAVGLTGLATLLLYRYHTVYADSAQTLPEEANESVEPEEQDKKPTDAPSEASDDQPTKPIDPWEALFDALSRSLEAEFNRTTDSMFQSGLNGLIDIDNTDLDPLHRLSYSSCTIPYPESGVTRVDLSFVPKETPYSTYFSSHFCVLPTHTWSLFGVFPTIPPSPRPHSASSLPPGHEPFEPSISRHTQPSAHTALYLHDKLLASVIGSLADLFSSLTPTPTTHLEVGLSESVGRAGEWFYHCQGTERPSPSNEVIDKVLEDAFLQVDNTICHEAIDTVFGDRSEIANLRRPTGALVGKKERASQFLGPAYAASEACVAFYESDTRVLKIANTGSKVRAILCRRNPNEKRRDFDAPPEYVGVDIAIPNNSVFGDAQYSGKWSKNVQKRLYEEFMGELPLEDDVVFEPRTAKPIINSVQTKPNDFLIFIRGLEDHLILSPSSSSPQTSSSPTPSKPTLSANYLANIVGTWLHRTIDGQAKSSDTIRLAHDLPLRNAHPDDEYDYEDDEENDEENQLLWRERLGSRASEVESLYKDPFTAKTSRRRSGEEGVSAEITYSPADEMNVATHLVRNVIGLQKKTIRVGDGDDGSEGDAAKGGIDQVVERIESDWDLGEARVRYLSRALIGAYGYGGSNRPREDICVTVIFFE